ncbi:MAG: hypothetical protein JXA49_03690, partial [Actinobacteria bacterium]|nr:hypothetical protein [Actinomycetota bacterium]
MEVKITTVEERYADVILETAVKGLDRPFCYLIPDRLSGTLDIGSLVIVPFGGRQALGYVTGFPSSCDYRQLKEISNVLDEPPLFDFDGQRLCKWISRRYMSSLSQSFKLLMPPGRGRNVKKVYSLPGDPAKASAAAGSMGIDEAAIIEAVIAMGGKADYATLKDH